MSIPFLVQVAVAAVEVATDPTLAGGGKKAMSAALQARCGDQHPLLVGEHLDYALLLVRSAEDGAAKVRFGSMSRDLALAELRRGYGGFPDESVDLAWSYGLQASDQPSHEAPMATHDRMRDTSKP
ncbi:MAG: hypothetical protein HOQ32_07945 [Lysobacter sp.]|nr:hypothetical protein [Lysobacter sp.]